MTNKLPRIDSGYIYAAKAIGSPFVKVGWSMSPMTRINTGATWCPYPIDVILIIEGDQERERSIQKDLRNQNQHREWFFLNDYSVAYLENLKDEDVRHGTDEEIEGD